MTDGKAKRRGGSAMTLDDVLGESAGDLAAAEAEVPRAGRRSRRRRPAGESAEPAALPVPLSVYLWPADRTRLRQLAVTESTTLQRLLVEGVNLLLHRRGLRLVKDVSVNRPSGRRRR